MTRISPRRHGYDTRWDKARAGFLANHPWCAWCAAEGRKVKAEHVHHSTPHGGDRRIFWDASKWMPLCVPHHNRDAQQIETRGYRDAVGTDGLPIDPAHPFYK